jgi:hypothetical protein
VRRAALALLLTACSSSTAPIDAGLADATTTAPERQDAGGTDGGAADAGAPTGLATLFVGNSYVYTHDVPGAYRALLAGRFDPLRVESVTAGGYTLARHAADAEADGTPLAAFLRAGSEAFDFVVLQEQSQLGGFPETNTERRASLVAARALGARAAERGATVVLFLTWGRARGDDSNPALFETFTAMQDRLDAGYRAMAEALRADGVDVRVAPVGGGFRLVHEAAVRAGLDPLAAGSDFLALYDPDGSHPSRRGAYLAACIFAGTTAAPDVRALPDDATLGVEVSASLRGTCADALADPRWR